MVLKAGFLLPGCLKRPVLANREDRRFAGRRHLRGACEGLFSAGQGAGDESSRRGDREED